MLSKRLEEEVEKRLPQGRAAHVLRVRDTALELAEQYGVDQEKAEIAALCHDIAKAMDPGSLRTILTENNMDERYLAFHHELWHAPVGAFIAQHEFGIKDEDILNAIRFHTTGRRGMSPLEKLIYVSDLIEPGRTFPGLKELQAAAGRSLDEGMRDSIAHTIAYLVSKRSAIFPDSFECYNEYAGIPNY